MLKITITEPQTERRWILQGKLVGPWVRLKRHHFRIELATAVRQIRRREQNFKEEQRS